jgi:molybdopterin synthase catalytic subunit
VHADVTDAVIEPSDVLGRVGDPSDGAVVLFLGVVRDHAGGRPVTGMTYEVYRAMAGTILGDIARAAAARLGTDHLAVIHRVGGLAVGEVSVAIAASSPHRAEAFAAARQVIEEIKGRLPVWKRERYADGEASWVSGVDPRADAGLESVTGPREPATREEAS